MQSNSLGQVADHSARDATHDNEWEVVTNEEADGRPRSPGNSSNVHFDITLGWGRWKHTLYSFDYSQNCQRAHHHAGHDAATDRPGDSAQDETRQIKSTKN